MDGDLNGRALLSDDDEAALVEAAISGQAAAFAALYDRHHERVYRHCYYTRGDPVAAEDLTQETFLNAWRAIGRYRRGGAPFIAWLLTIAHNLSLNDLRRERGAAALPPPPVPRWADPEAMVAAGVAAATLRAAILRLAPERRRVILLRFVEEFTVAEVASVLGKSEGNIRVIQHRALADLRRLLDEADGAARPTERAAARGPLAWLARRRA